VQPPAPKKTNLGLILGILGGFFLVLIIIVFFLFLVLGSSDVKISSSELASGKTVELKPEQMALFDIDEEEHSVTLDSIGADSVGITVRSTPITETLAIGDENKFDLDDDGVYDLSVTLIEIADEKANIRVKKISETICTVDWNCGNWTECTVEGSQTRVCTDLNSCGDDSGKPVEIQPCTYIEPCTENWNCTNWTACTSGNQTRNCTDLNNCSTIVSMPAELQSCGGEIVDCGGDWDCYLASAAECDISNMIFDTGLIIGDSIINQSTYTKINGLSEGNCSIFFRRDSYIINYTAEARQALLDAGNTTEQIELMLLEENLEVQSMVVGNSSDCVGNPVNITNLLSNWSVGNLVSHSDFFDSCTGSYFGTS
jgi:hypothetical protein